MPRRAAHERGDVVHELIGERLHRFVASVPLDDVIAHLKRVEGPIVEGPVERTGATRKIRSVDVRDPGLHLIEISELI